MPYIVFICIIIRQGELNYHLDVRIYDPTLSLMIKRLSVLFFCEDAVYHPSNSKASPTGDKHVKNFFSDQK